MSLRALCFDELSLITDRLSLADEAALASTCSAAWQALADAHRARRAAVIETDDGFAEVVVRSFCAAVGMAGDGRLEFSEFPASAGGRGLRAPFPTPLAAVVGDASLSVEVRSRGRAQVEVTLHGEDVDDYLVTMWLDIWRGWRGVRPLSVNVAVDDDTEVPIVSAWSEPTPAQRRALVSALTTPRFRFWVMRLFGEDETRAYAARIIQAAYRRHRGWKIPVRWYDADMW